VWTALWLAIQVALPVGASIADANFAARTDGRAHIEDAASLGCVPSHGADCGICKQLSGASLAPQSAASGSARSPDSAVSAARPLPRQAARFAVGLPRAPPIFLA
jgi:hypothetical protein